MQYGNIKFSRVDNTKIFHKLSRRVQYHTSTFGFNSVNSDGKFVRLCVIDTGVPQIDNYAVDMYKCKNFTNSGSVYDVHGHSSALAGILHVNNKFITGMVPNIDIYYAKAITDDPKNTNIDNIIDALLWCIVREIDIVLMSFGTHLHHSGFADVIKKVYSSGISLIAASGNHTSKTHDAEYPALYNEVYAVGYSNNISYNQAIYRDQNCTGLIMPYVEYDTTFLQNKYIKMGGSSISAASVAGLACLCVQDMRRRGIDPKNPQSLYNNLGKFAVKT